MSERWMITLIDWIFWSWWHIYLSLVLLVGFVALAGVLLWVWGAIKLVVVVLILLGLLSAVLRQMYKRQMYK